MKSKLIFPLTIGLLIGLAAGFLIMTVGVTGNATAGDAVSKETAGQLVVDWLAANDVSSELLVVNEADGLYDVTVRDSKGTASDFYVTKNGFAIVQPAVVDVKATTGGLVARRTFFECLASKGLAFFGSTETNATQFQLQIFGGVQFVDRIYVSCDGNYTQTCIDAGITEVPMFLYNNQTYSGAQNIDWFVNLTGCNI